MTLRGGGIECEDELCVAQTGGNTSGVMGKEGISLSHPISSVTETEMMFSFPCVSSFKYNEQRDKANCCSAQPRATREQLGMIQSVSLVTPTITLQ